MYNRINNKKYIKIIKIPKNTEINISNEFYFIKGPNGSVKQKINKNIEIKKILDEIHINLKEREIKKKEFLKLLPIVNTTNIIIKNSFEGVLNLYTYSLSIKGIGYKAKYEKDTKKLQLHLGFTNVIEMEIKKDIEIEIIDSINIIIKGSSKQEVGQLASDIKNKKPVEIYKGNGIKYKDEIIKLKTPKKKQK